MKIRVFMITAKGPEEHMTLEAADYADAGEQVRKMASDAGLQLRAMSLTEDGGAVAYVQDPPAEINVPKKGHGKPVRHDGVIGRGREIRRRRPHERQGKGSDIKGKGSTT